MLWLDPDEARLLDAEDRGFEAATLAWSAPEPGRPRGRALEPAAAVRWLQRDSGTPCRVPVAVIGGREAGAEQLAQAEAVGRGLAELGLVLLCGGREGVMAAACRGAAEAGGLSIGLLPDEHWSAANPHAAIVLASGIGVARNAVIARAGLCLIAIGGGHGTLSEMAFGLQFGRPVFALPGAPAVAGARVLADWPALEPALCRAVLGLEG